MKTSKSTLIYVLILVNMFLLAMTSCKKDVAVENSKQEKTVETPSDKSADNVDKKSDEKKADNKKVNDNATDKQSVDKKEEVKQEDKQVSPDPISQPPVA